MTGSNEKLLVLDLDETLVHATERPLERPEDFVVGLYWIYKRPHLDQFVRYVLDAFSVGIWTASGEKYAAGVIGRIFPPNALQFVWTSQRCTLARDFETGDYQTYKKLDKLKARGYRLESIIAVDDTPQKHRKNYGNLVTVKEYAGQAEDDELLHLISYLEYLKTVPNVRAVEKRGWRKSIQARGVENGA
ncbi:MAG TPA: HAD family hydrolase [Burkholderiales bacterium]|nr:HAD family hydrolase [Burkholderiales bacterium]